MDELAEYERRFRRAGLPLLIEDYDARAESLTRAAPLLTLVFLGEMLGAVDLEWSLPANIAAALGGLVFLVVSVGIANRLRSRPFFSRPERAGRLEALLFVLLPALLPLVFGGQVRSAVGTAVANVLILGLVYAVVGFRLDATVRHASVGLLSQFAISVAALTRAIPLLLLFALVLFMTTEVWQVLSTMPPAFLAAASGVLVAFGGLFLLAQLPAEISRLEEASGAGRPLTRGQRLNVGLLLLARQSLQVVLVSAAMGAFFVAFGALAVGPELRQTWIGTEGNVLLTVSFLGERAQVTEELLRVAGGIAAFSGLYFAIAVLTDATYRGQFLDRLTADLRETFALRTRYLELRAARSGG